MFPLSSPVCCTDSSCWWKSKFKNFLKCSHFRSLSKVLSLTSWMPALGDARGCGIHHAPSRKTLLCQVVKQSSSEKSGAAHAEPAFVCCTNQSPRQSCCCCWYFLKRWVLPVQPLFCSLRCSMEQTITHPRLPQHMAISELRAQESFPDNWGKFLFEFRFIFTWPGRGWSVWRR